MTSSSRRAAKMAAFSAAKAAKMAGLGATIATASPALAQDNDYYVSVGGFVSYTFAAPRPWGLGFEARGGVSGASPNRGCSDELDAFYYGGGALRFEWFPQSHEQLTLIAQGGRAFAFYGGAHAEVGVGYRFGAEHGLRTLLGAEFDLAFTMLALHVEPLRGEITPALGLIVPPVGMPLFVGCAVEGRPLRADHGFAPLPPIALAASDSARRATEVPNEVVTQWSKRAQTELASVPAFRELAEQLHMVGAPADLIARSQAAARDELHHALMAANHCAALSDQQVQLRSDGVIARPRIAGPQAMVRLAIESWIDGCLGEGVAAACAAEEARLATTDDIRSTQAQVAIDEARHAELAWDVLTWALAVGGSEVHRALHAVADARATNNPSDAAPRGLEAFGILSDARIQDLAHLHRQQSLQRLDHLLAG